MTLSGSELQKTYEDCVESCADALYRVAFRLTGNPTLASELVQETYLNAWKSLPTLSDPNKMKSWMFSILRNQYSKLIRKESRSVSPSELIHEAAAQTAADTEAADEVQAAIAQLDEKHRMPLLLVSMEGLSAEAAAGILDIPRGTVLSRLHRARQKLKSILGLTDDSPQQTLEASE
jgi:RNA polymerase sigma-70 factor (ECF subfamily)